MATLTLNPVVTSISGTIGRMVFYKRNNRTIARAWIMPPNPDTPAQKKNRSLFSEAMRSWQSLSGDEKAAYNRRARKLSMSGHNLFISRYMKAKTAGNRDNPDSKDAIPPTFALSKQFALSVTAIREITLSKEVALSNTSAPATDVSFFQRGYRSVAAPSLTASSILSPSKGTYNPLGAAW